jgi:hypothetical protein
MDKRFRLTLYGLQAGRHCRVIFVCGSARLDSAMATGAMTRTTSQLIAPKSIASDSH